MELGIKGKIAIVTGGSKGIGRATALCLLDEGASVLVCARGAEALAEVARIADSRGGDRFATISADLTRAEDIRAVVERCEERFGGVDILVNNAGSARPGEFLLLDDQAWIDDWTLKVLGYVRMARATLPVMKRRGGGAVVNVGGGGGLRPAADYTIGGMINASVLHFTKALAKEGAKYNVRVVGVHPGPILTERLMRFSSGADAASRSVPLGRVGKSEEVADLITFLASARASFVTGTNISIDGGSNPGLMG